MHDFTYNYVKRLVDQGTPPDMVAIGNEIINGFLWGSESAEIQYEQNGAWHGVTTPAYAVNNKDLFWSQPGGGILWKYWRSTDPVEQQKYEESWDRFSTLVAAGIKAVREVSPDIAVELHTTVNKSLISPDYELPKTMEFWHQLLTRINAKGADPDNLAMSYYSYYHGTFDDLEHALYAYASTYPQYKINIAETAYPATGGSTPWGDSDQPRTIQGQANMLQRTIQAANDVIDNKGIGVLMWEPQSYQPIFTRAPGMFNYYEPYASIDVFNKSFAKHVLESNVYVSTLENIAPVLPATVKMLTMSDASVEPVPVTWNAVDPSQYENAGGFTVTGTTEYGEVTANVSVFADLAPEVFSSLDSQSVQYTDSILPVTIDATDVAADLPLQASSQWSLDGGAFQPGLPSWLALTPAPCTSDSLWGACSWTLASNGPVPVQAGTYQVRTTVSDGTSASDVDVTLQVTPEDAYLQYSGEAIAQIGSELNLRATVWDNAASGYPGINVETVPGATTGDLSRVWVAFDLYPDQSCLTGVPTTLYTQASDTGIAGDGIGTASTTFTAASEASYCVVARLVAGPEDGTNAWYTADNAETALLVFYENSGQFATGGGWVDDPGGSKGNFGFTARYLKKGQVQGHAAYVYRGVYQGEQADFIIKSNALNGLAFGGVSYPIPVTLQGKCTLQINRSSDGSLLYSEGNATFQVMVVDSGDNSAGGDTFSIVVYDRNGVTYKEVPTSPLGGGNVVIHQ